MQRSEDREADSRLEEKTFAEEAKASSGEKSQLKYSYNLYIYLL